ncbi:PilN domain-containing protein [Xiashengella succiniciproducens]|jgi:Tfp pilus assembly protein PilN|uniref:PilN domain-containing protein n=1 Tax=Xiashengella succiniciproducens TaxID=2949635 RepID=A0A9J6ZSR4_9BACT|nr:PilN domain-containing protein [Alkaliflexus sp. Ai-910]URW80625.1 PilN domain-containing protein [Alkaliflexus sp. Ai-910]
MQILSGILNKINILVVEFQASDTTNIQAYIAKFNRNQIQLLPVNQSELTPQELTVVLYAGYGVLTKNKDDNTELLEKIKLNTEVYLYTEDTANHTLSFMRKEQLSKHVFSENYLVINQGCIANIQPPTIQSYIKNVYIKQIQWKSLFRIDSLGQQIATAFVKKTKMFFLLGCLSILILNAFIGHNISTKYKDQHKTLVLLRKKLDTEKRMTNQQIQRIQSFKSNLPYNYAWLCDQIASVVPLSIFLTELSIQPPLKSNSIKDKQSVDENRIYISGESSDSKSISQFIEDLEKLSFIKKTQLEKVTSKSNADKLSFLIKIEI